MKGNAPCDWPAITSVSENTIEKPQSPHSHNEISPTSVLSIQFDAGHYSKRTRSRENVFSNVIFTYFLGGRSS